MSADALVRAAEQLKDAVGFCDWGYDGFGTSCWRCGSWIRGHQQPTCPPYITRMEPDGKRLPHIKTVKQNNEVWNAWRTAQDIALPALIASHQDREG